jgi:hypothetical protein
VNELTKVNTNLRELHIKSNPGLAVDKQLAMMMFPKLRVLNGEIVRESQKPPMP